MRGLGVTQRCACLMHGHRFAKETQLTGSKSLDIAVYRTIYLFFFSFFPPSHCWVELLDLILIPISVIYAMK